MYKFIEQLEDDFPGLVFRAGKKFMFRPPKTIVFEQQKNDERSKLLILHEVGHALLEHKNFNTDIERVKMERDAWEKAKELCERYNVFYDEELVEAELDTYRDWLHRKSRCPQCGLTRYQGEDGRYICPKCDGIESLKRF